MLRGGKNRKGGRLLGNSVVLKLFYKIVKLKILPFFHFLNWFWKSIFFLGYKITNQMYIFLAASLSAEQVWFKDEK